MIGSRRIPFGIKTVSVQCQTISFDVDYPSGRLWPSPLLSVDTTDLDVITSNRPIKEKRGESVDIAMK